MAIFRAWLMYKGYQALLEHDTETGRGSGHVPGIKSEISFVTDDVGLGAQAAFEAAIDDYLLVCGMMGEEAEMQDPKALKGGPR